MEENLSFIWKERRQEKQNYFASNFAKTREKGKSVNIPIDREEYEELLGGLKKISREKKVRVGEKDYRSPPS